jgi:hypothetical protein
MRMRVRNKDGLEIMDIKSIEQDGNRIVVKGKMMGTMATTIVVTPDGVWDVYRLCPRAMILRLPLLLFKGWRMSNRND